jgi:hypothetical protein
VEPPPAARLPGMKVNVQKEESNKLLNEPVQMKFILSIQKKATTCTVDWRT